jgi:hypothetical protein
MTTLAIREDIQKFVDNILEWDFYTDVIDDHENTSAARERLSRGSMFLSPLVCLKFFRC